MAKLNRGVQRCHDRGTAARRFPSILLALSMSTMVAMPAQAASHDAAGLSEPDAAVVVPLGKESDMAVEPEDRLVILPEIKREGERFFLKFLQAA